MMPDPADGANSKSIDPRTRPAGKNNTTWNTEILFSEEFHHFKRVRNQGDNQPHLENPTGKCIRKVKHSSQSINLIRFDKLIAWLMKLGRMQIKRQGSES
ncbi:hypothetical protein scyTo_0021663 [Scyliorhinus torazame]|uniref:Uncharacterized protein n=1 Tax=Scyliorhinus torazame TaxID=75743 RepID=A0A401QBA2_SCYTO|nr:hypothetical protein [Scyliorhinus torazame]